MVKRCLLLITLCMIISGFTTIPKEKTTNDNINMNYSIVKKKINLLPIVPYSILGLNTYIYKDAKGLDYLITVTPKIKEYSWLIDTIKLDKKLLKNKDNTALPGTTTPINLYLEETIDLKFSVKVLNKDIKCDYFTNLTLPYFIIVNDKKTNKIWLLKDKTVNLNLVNNKTFIVTEDIKIVFNESKLSHLEILVAFKQNYKEFNTLKTYIYNENLKNKNN